MTSSSSVMRFAIWAAVSSKIQAATDKVSLDEQQNKCRTTAARKGWRETAGPYVVPGESRTRWINLRDAEKEIPALRDMLNDAQRGLFDVLVLYDYTRLRELLDPVSRALAAYGVQLYSIGQPVEPVQPDQYDPYATDAASIVQTVSGLTSRAEINALRRRYRIGVPRRASDKGLHPVGKVPYGYRRAPGREFDKSAPFVPDPVQAQVVVEMKDLYLAGYSVPQIIDHLEQKGIKTKTGSKRWSDYTVRYILKNPFYAGIVTFGRQRVIRDPRTGARKTVQEKDPDKIVQAQGKHVPLWDLETHQALIKEHKRRHKVFKGMKTYRLSNLLYCKEHNRGLYVKYIRGIRDDEHRVWYCPEGPKGHWHLVVRDSQVLVDLPEVLVQDLERMQDLEIPDQGNDLSLLEQAIGDLEQRKERLLDGLEQGILGPEVYSQRIEPLEKQIRDYQDTLFREQQKEQNKSQRVEALSLVAQAIQAVPGYIQNGHAQKVNASLRRLIHRIYVGTNGLEIDYN